MILFHLITNVEYLVYQVFLQSKKAMSWEFYFKNMLSFVSVILFSTFFYYFKIS